MGVDPHPLSEEAAPAGRRRALGRLVPISLLIVAGAGFLQVVAGSFHLSVGGALASLFDSRVWGNSGCIGRFLLGDHLANGLGLAPAPVLPTATLIVWNVRLPRVIVATLVGIDLSFSGSIFQAITRNELASPYLLGVSSGAGLAILVVLVLLPAHGAHLPLIAMVGGAVAFLVVYAIAWHHGTSPVRLVLAGVIVAAIAGSLQTAVFLLARDVSVVQDALAWTTGSLTGVGWEQVRLIAPFTLAVVVLALSSARYLDVLLLGDPAAKALGMSVERVRFLLAGTAILAAASAVSVAGLVGFVGLIIPHIVRSTVGSAHRSLLVGCLCAGPALMVTADAAARLALSPVQVPVGIVTGVLGGVFFLFLMRRRREFGRP